jgi:hypothetical protein
MKGRSRPLALLAVMLLAIAITGVVTAAAPAAAGGNCVVRIDPLQRGQQSSHVSQPQCFATFAEAIAAATGGAVHLSPSVKPSQLTQAMLGVTPYTTTVIGVDYVDSNYGGNSLTWTSTSGGCTSTQSFQASSMPSGWNDVVSSALSYQNCNTYWHFQDSGFGGAQLDCGPSCATMGVMNDQTSSEKWLR